MKFRSTLYFVLVWLICYFISGTNSLAAVVRVSAPTDTQHLSTFTLSPPATATCSWLTTSSLSLTWSSKAAPVNGYTVKEGPNLSETQITYTGASLTATDSTVNESGSYAIFSKINSLESQSAVRVSPADCSKIAPAAPTGLAGSALLGSVSLTWNPITTTMAAPVTGYKVYRNGTFIANTTSPSFSQGGLSLFIGYTYRVTAYGPAGESPVSNSVYFLL